MISRRLRLTTLARINSLGRQRTDVLFLNSGGRSPRCGGLFLMREGTVTGPSNSVWAVTVTLQGLASPSKCIKLRKHPPEQLRPFPLYAGLQLQLKEPLVLMQMASLLQL